MAMPAEKTKPAVQPFTEFIGKDLADTGKLGIKKIEDTAAIRVAEAKKLTRLLDALV